VQAEGPSAPPTAIAASEPSGLPARRACSSRFANAHHTFDALFFAANDRRTEPIKKILSRNFRNHQLQRFKHTNLRL
jgi:hypothetical protein